MKSIIKVVFILFAFLNLASCTANYEDYNSNPNEADDSQITQDGKRLSSAMVGMENNIIPATEHLYQFVEILVGTTYGGYLADSKLWDNSFALYNPTQDWLDKPMEIIVGVYMNYYTLKSYTNDPVLLAIADVIKVSAMSRIADIYGPIPYTKMETGGKLENTYDSQEEAYDAFFSDLNASLKILEANRTVLLNENLDYIYDGSIEDWIKFANSLKLRLAMRISYINPTMAKEQAETAINHPVGTITSNSDNAVLPVEKHPLNVVVGEWGDSRAAADICSYMNGYVDPRREKYFSKSTFEANITNDYYGLRRGVKMSSKPMAMKYASVNLPEVTKGGIAIMTASEVAFLKAEAALRGWNTPKTAEYYYEEGIRISFEQWNATNVEQYISDNVKTPNSYFDPLGTYSYSGTLGAVTIAWDEKAGFEKNLERIITQKWIAIFPLGIEAWSEYRRTGYPILMPSPLNLSGGIVNDAQGARRLPYPQSEYRENNDNVLQAVQKLGGNDNMSTNVWWDCKNK